MRTVGLTGCGLGRDFRSILASLLLLGATLPTPSHAGPQPSERERTFLKLVFSGDEAKAVEYAQVANIDVNSIAGEPLSAWFYKDGRSPSDRYELRNTAVQKIVFERFRQNPNPVIGEPNNLENYCAYSPFQQNIPLESTGTPDQIKALREQQDAQRRPHIEAMGAGFDSLVRYGLKDKQIITKLFLGCLYRTAATRNAYYYDTVLGKMVRAGANINVQTQGGERPIHYVVKGGNDVLVEKFIRDGAQADYLVLQNGFDKPVAGENCSPRRYRSLYGIVFEWARPRNSDALVAMVRALSLGGLSPLTKYGYIDNRDGSQKCVYASFLDAVIDTGNIELAKRVKEAAAVSPAGPTAPATSASPPTATAAAAAPAPTQIGAWRIATENGRLVAVAKADRKTSNGFAALRLECVGGRLEYVPVALKLNGPMTSLWISIAGDAKEMKLVNQRAAGPSASMLSKEFMANEPKAGEPQDWGIEMTVEQWNSVGDNVVMTGFSRVRAYMLANCKNG